MNKLSVSTNILRTLSVALFLICLPAGAQTVHTWTGASGANNYWTTGTNWNNGTPGWLDGYTEFPNPAPGTTQIIDMNNYWYNGASKLLFETSGYRIEDNGGGAAGIRLDDVSNVAGDDIRSVGVGVNEIAVGFAFGSTTNDTRNVTVGTGNHLLFSGSFQSTPVFYSGGGTLVIDQPTDDTARNFNAQYNITDNNFTLLLNNIEATNTDWTLGTVGGNGGILNYGNGVDTDFTGTTFMVGGDGTAAGGDEIGTFTFRSWDVANTGRSYVDFNAGTTVEMQIDTLGNNDKVLLELANPTNQAGNLRIGSGVTLDLFGTVIPDGTYILFENVGYEQAMTGTFGTVNFNGSPIDPSNFQLNYNGNNITLDVTGLSAIPELSSLLLLGLSGISIFLLRRRK